MSALLPPRESSSAPCRADLLLRLRFVLLPLVRNTTGHRGAVKYMKQRE